METCMPGRENWLKELAQLIDLSLTCSAASSLPSAGTTG